MIKVTNEEIAESFKLWGEYVDTLGIDSEEDFDNMDLEDKFEILMRLE
jgi:hypothetical protein